MATNDDYLGQLKEKAKQKGVSFDEDSYRADLERTYEGQGGQGGRTSEDIFNDLSGQIDRRAAPSSSGGGGGSSSPAQAWNSAPQRDPRADALYSQLLQRSQQGLQVDRNDPVIRQQSDAFSAQQERQRRNYVSDAAEGMGPYAGGALQGEKRMASERAGIASGAFEAELIGREVASRRDEIAQALTQLQGVLSGDQEAALRRELAQLEAVLQREGYDLQRQGMGMQNDQFLRQLAQRQYEYDNQWPF